MKLLKGISAAIMALMGAVLALPAAAATIDPGLAPIAATTVLGTSDIRIIIARIIYVALGILGVVVLVIIIYAGFLWMTAGGNEDQVAKAKRWIWNAVIGLIIILSSYALTAFIVGKLLGAAAGGGTVRGGQNPPGGNYATGSLGEGIVKSHFPAPGASNIARNTKIIVTFKIPIDPNTIMTGATSSSANGVTVTSGDLNLENVRIAKTSDLASGGAFETSSSKLVSGVRAFTADNATFAFAPSQFLGSPNEAVSYTVSLGNGILLSDGHRAFDGNFAMGYHWEFATGTSIDTKPPKVISIFPEDGVSVKQNATIQINFDEAVDPTSASGPVPGLDNVRAAVGGAAIPGVWEPSNQYRSISFRTNVKGGTNSCGDDVYVLPANASVAMLIKSAAVGNGKSGEPEAPQAKFYPPDGVVDVAGNSLDGDGNGQGEGSPKDDVSWNFSTGSGLELTAPKIVGYDPQPEQGGAELDKPVGILFSRQISMASLSNENLHFRSKPSIPLWYFGAGQDMDAEGNPVAVRGVPVARTQGLIVHERLMPTVGACSGGAREAEACTVAGDCPGGTCRLTAYLYYPTAGSGVKDMYQNCFLPACNTDPDRPYCCVTASREELSCAAACAAANDGSLYCPSK